MEISPRKAVNPLPGYSEKGESLKPFIQLVSTGGNNTKELDFPKKNEQDDQC